MVFVCSNWALLSPHNSHGWPCLDQHLLKAHNCFALTKPHSISFSLSLCSTIQKSSLQICLAIIIRLQSDSGISSSSLCSSCISSHLKAAIKLIEDYEPPFRLKCGEILLRLNKSMKGTFHMDWKSLNGVKGRERRGCLSLVYNLKKNQSFLSSPSCHPNISNLFPKGAFSRPFFPHTRTHFLQSICGLKPYFVQLMFLLACIHPRTSVVHAEIFWKAAAGRVPVVHLT